MLDVEIEFIKGIFFIRLSGSLDKTTTDILYKRVSSLIIKYQMCNVVFNLEELDKIDLDGINSLLYNYNLCKKNNGTSMLCNINNSIKEIVGNIKSIPITSNELTALNIINI